MFTFTYKTWQRQHESNDWWTENNTKIKSQSPCSLQQSSICTTMAAWIQVVNGKTSGWLDWLIAAWALKIASHSDLTPQHTVWLKNNFILCASFNGTLNVKGLTECRQAAADTIYCIELCQSLNSVLAKRAVAEKTMFVLLAWGLCQVWPSRLIEIMT